jgi:hypothetical protein
MLSTQNISVKRPQLYSTLGPFPDAERMRNILHYRQNISSWDLHHPTLGLMTPTTEKRALSDSKVKSMR